MCFAPVAFVNGLSDVGAQDLCDVLYEKGFMPHGVNKQELAYRCLSELDPCGREKVVKQLDATTLGHLKEILIERKPYLRNTEAGDAFRMLCTFSDKLSKLIDGAKVLESHSLILDFAEELHNDALMPDVRSVPQEIDDAKAIDKFAEFLISEENVKELPEEWDENAKEEFKGFCLVARKFIRLISSSRYLGAQTLVLDYADGLTKEPAVCADSETERRKNVLSVEFMNSSESGLLFSKLSTCLDVLKIKNLYEAPPAIIDRLFVYYCEYYSLVRRKEMIEALRTDVIDVRRHKTALHFQNVFKQKVSSEEINILTTAIRSLSSVQLDELYRHFKAF